MVTIYCMSAQIEFSRETTYEDLQFLAKAIINLWPNAHGVTLGIAADLPSLPMPFGGLKVGRSVGILSDEMTEESFALSLTKATWELLGAYALVTVVMTCLDSVPSESYSFDLQRYEEFLSTPATEGEENVEEDDDESVQTELF